MANHTETAKQIEIAERLQTKMLEHFEHLLMTREITSTDMATLCRLFMANGWRLDPHALPERLRDKIPNLPNPSEFADGEEDWAN